MKYIRTPFAIFEVVEETDVVYRVRAKWTPSKIYSKSKCQTEVIKKADTIEELCDEFVDTSELKTTNTGGWLYDEFDSDNKCLVYYAEDERRTIPLNEFEDLSKIYGAIWTHKGLIYVAKMNDKGEFELL